MGPEQLNGNETDDQLREKAENGISQILADIETGNIPDEYYDLDEYLRYVANETTPYDKSKTRKQNDAAKESAFQKLKTAAGAEGINSKGISQHQLLEDLESEFKDKMGDIDVLNGGFTTEQLKTMLQDAVRAKAIKTSIFPVLRMLAFLKKGAHLEKLQTVENKLGLGTLGKMLLSSMPPETLAFIQQVAKEKWTAVEIVQLAPMLLEMLKRPDYMLFNSSIKLESIDVAKNEDFLVSTDKPTIGTTISPKIPAKSLESDLVILSIRNPALATHFIQTLRTVATSQAPKGRRASSADFAFNVKPDMLAQKALLIKQIADRYSALIASGMGKSPEASQDGTVDMWDTSPSAQETRNLKSISQTIKQKRDNLKFSVAEGNRTPGQNEDLERWDMAITFIENCNDLKKFMDNFYEPNFKKEKQRAIKEQTAKRNPVYRNTPYEKLPAGEIAESIREMGGEEECDKYAAIETAHAIEEMLKHLVMTMYTDVIEAGGEPEVDFNTAVSKTVSGWSVSAKQMVSLVSKRLTSIKTGAFGVAKSDDRTLIRNLLFAVAERGKSGEVQYDKHSKYINENGEERTVTTNEIEYRVGSSNAAFAGLAQSLEMGFDTFNAMIEGSYAMRYWYNMDGKKYFEHMTNPAHREYIASRTFDHYHAMAGSELAAQIVPTVKMIMLDFFNERGWIVGEELNEEVFGHKSTIYTQVNDFLTKNYPELSDSKRREVAYAAIHQTYAHFQPQQILSRTRGTVGFRGKLYGDDHAHFAPFRRFYSYGYDGAGAPSKHEGWGKGSMALPAWQDLRSKVWKVQDKPRESEFENITWTSPYGGLIEYGSRQFGHFLTYTDREHFDGTIPKTMLPYNILDGGSDDKLRGWRQNNKVIGNVSTSLYERKSASDDIQLSSTYTQPDHITNIWKSVENVGINYVRSMMETLGQMTVDPATGAIKDEAKIEHLYRFLYRRYFRSGQTESPQLAKFREHMLTSFPALQGQAIGSDDEFWLAVKTQITQSKSAAIHEPLLNRVYTIMLAERNPMTFMTISTSWTTQTGETLWNKVKAECKKAGSGFVENEEEFGGKWDEVRNDLILIQSEARGQVTKDIRANRKTWQKQAGPDKNIFGDFTQDRSEVSVDGKGKGYVITEETIEKILREKFGQSQDVEARIARAKKVYGNILGGMIETPDLPEYEKVKGFLTENMGDAFSDVPPADRPNYAAEITKRLGADQATYEQRYKGKLKSRSDWFLQSWEQGMFGIEPEADYAEDLTVYANADERHIFRMADIVNRTTVEIKKVLSDPDNEFGFTEMVKTFAKDPYKAIDAMAGYLNKFRKVITRERGPDYAPRYMNYYVTMIVDAAVKDDKYRSGMSFEGFVGIWNNFASATFGKNKQSLATDRFQVFVGKDMDAREGFKIIKFLEQKKLINDEGSRVLRKRLHATIPDIIWEMSPYLAIFFLYTFVQKSIVDPLSENLDLDTGGGGKGGKKK